MSNLLTRAKVNQPALDAEAHRLWVNMEMNVAGAGPVKMAE